MYGSGIGDLNVYVVGTSKEKKVAQNMTILSRAVLSCWLGILTDTKTN